MASIQELQGDQAGIKIRCGVATGMMVVGKVMPEAPANRGDVSGSTSFIDTAAVGDPPSLAASLQKLADPNTVLISERTQRLVRDIFDYRDLGSIGMKCFERPEHVWQVISERAIRSRFAALRSPLIAPLVGRSTEVEKLTKLWNAAAGGVGRIVVIRGDPGIGKSRLVETIAEKIVPSRCRQFWYYCSPHLQNSALAPIVN